MIDEIRKELKAKRSPEKAKVMSGFFKTGEGEYGEGDIFLGVNVPDQRMIANKYSGISFEELEALLSSRIHEHRLTALLILAGKYGNDKEKVFDFCMKNLSGINNWDLVDTAAPSIIGRHIIGADKAILYKLARSDNLWERRISIVSTYAFIRNNKFDDALKIAEILLKDRHDLIHKAVGWMLREVGKRDMKALEKFLMKHRKEMPRTTLRYAIERMPERKRKLYLKR